ncbi:MAG: hypothetical protein ACLTDR_04830 [Adlercreutzia equolifaciens]
MDVLRKERGDAGQATVELAVVLPSGHCARRHRRERACRFSRHARLLTSWPVKPSAPMLVGRGGPGVGRGGSLCGKRELEEALGTSNPAIEVTVQGRAGSYQRYCGRLSFAPTPFGLGLKDEVFGVSAPRLVHESI